MFDRAKEWWKQKASDVKQTFVDAKKKLFSPNWAIDRNLWKHEDGTVRVRVDRFGSKKCFDLSRWKWIHL